MVREERTEPVPSVTAVPHAARRVAIRIVGGPAAGRGWSLQTDRIGIGSHPANDVVLDADPDISPFHCELEVTSEGLRVRDRHSASGTFIDGVRVVDAFLPDAASLVVGATLLSIGVAEPAGEMQPIAPTAFGSLVGVSKAMRRVFAELERAASTDATVLLEGETGTGKERAAQALHDASRRRDGPFVVVDCAALPETLIESELYGHEKGAFTGAVSRRIGAFEAADGGTVFLDEIGELPLAMQPRLLRVLETRTVRRLGSQEPVPVDVRVIAATHRDLRAEVNAGRFREDLYFRLAVICIRLPPLRERPEDIPPLAERLLEALGASVEERRRLLTPSLVARLRAAPWPGNVRELRNFLTRCLALRELPPLPAATDGGCSSRLPEVDARVPYEASRRAWIDTHERAYVSRLLDLHEGNVSAAARAAGLHRGYLHRLLRKHGLRGR
ncbi:MAG: sigma 54-interacting transcriptional regulator [Myxococcota bacterium]|nr:sigma 54-interacting transcriptional regulator [Myxococcota bacterium]MDW8361461.1 sigma 54-interacting transcriptional regulator [Myxococcales bacterium]